MSDFTEYLFWSVAEPSRWYSMAPPRVAWRPPFGGGLAGPGGSVRRRRARQRRTRVRFPHPREQKCWRSLRGSNSFPQSVASQMRGSMRATIPVMHYRVKLKSLDPLWKSWRLWFARSGGRTNATRSTLQPLHDAAAAMCSRSETLYKRCWVLERVFKTLPPYPPHTQLRKRFARSKAKAFFGRTTPTPCL